MVLKYVDAHFKKSTQKKLRKRMFERKNSLKKVEPTFQRKTRRGKLFKYGMFMS